MLMSVRGLRVALLAVLFAALLCAEPTRASLRAPGLELETESFPDKPYVEPASRRLEASEGEVKKDPSAPKPAADNGAAAATTKKKRQKNSLKNGFKARYLSNVKVKAVRHSGETLGYFNAVKVEMYPTELEHPWFSELSFVFDDAFHAQSWVSSTPTKKSPDNTLKMSVAIREGVADDRGYISRAARIITSSEEIDSIAWLLGGLGEDSFLDSSSEFDWTECPARGHLDDGDAMMATLRDCAIIAMERGKLYDEYGKVMPLITKSPRLPVVTDDGSDTTWQKLQDFLEKNRKRDGRLGVEVIVTDNDQGSWTKTVFKFAFFGAMIPFGIWLYKKKKDMDLRSEKII